MREVQRLAQMHRAWRCRGLYLWVLAAALLVWCVRPESVQAESLAPNIDAEVVYLDPDGVIHVFDPNRPNDVLYVDWRSPDSGWTQIQLGDVNGDGDEEIITLGPTETGGRLAIYDPVARDVDPAGLPQINGVPWTKLYETAISGLPRLLLTGEFDATRPGIELLYGAQREPGEDRDRFVILRQPEGSSRGEVWEQLRAWELGGVWTQGAVGDVGAGADVVGLVDNQNGRLEVYRVSPSVVRQFQRSNPGNRWRDVAFGQFASGGAVELGAVRDADLPLASAWVFRYENGTFVDDYFLQLSPGPLRVFFADIGGNGDDELVMLRQVPQEFGPRPRLIIRDRGNDTLGFSEELLDGDNEHQGGAGGDVDGDGRDEIVLIRNNRIRIYPEPERSATRVETLMATNGRTVVVGNVDAVGLARTPVLFSTITRVAAELAPGEASAPVALRLVDVASSTNLPFTYRLENAAWADVTVSSNTLPVTLTVTLRADDLQSGEYSGRLIIEAAGSEIGNNPWIVGLNLAVDSGVTTEPSSLFFEFEECANAPASEARLQLNGPEGVAYTLALTGDPDWVTVAPEAGMFPEAVTLTADATRSQGQIAETNLVVSFDLPNAPGLFESVPIVLACDAAKLYLPSVLAVAD